MIHYTGPLEEFDSIDPEDDIEGFCSVFEEVSGTQDSDERMIFNIFAGGCIVGSAVGGLAVAGPCAAAVAGLAHDQCED